MQAKKQKQVKKVVPSVSATATSSTTPATAGDPSAGLGATTLGAPTTSSAALGYAAAATPPDITVPSIPTGWVPGKLSDFRGSHAKAGQITAAPGAIAELQADAGDYEEVFGQAVPPATQIASKLTVALKWTTLRVAFETYLPYLKANEAIAWKSGLADLSELDAIFQVVARQNPVLIDGFPELEKLLDVDKAIGQKAAAARVRNARAKASAAPAAGATSPTGGVTAPTVTPTAAGAVASNGLAPAAAGSAAPAAGSAAPAAGSAAPGASTTTVSVTNGGAGH